MLAAAIDYAGRGWPVFPLHTPVAGSCSCRKDCGKQAGKHPRTEHGFEDASVDLDQVRSWWTRWPDANIGVRTGVVCDLFDIDHHDQIEGTADMPWAIDMPGGPVVRTGAGWHYYLQPTGLGNRARFSAHCDWRGVGGYSILPPSLHHSGRRYEWFTPITVPLQPVTAELLDLLTNVPAPAPPRSVPQSPSPSRFTNGGWSAAGIIGKMAIATDGTRNDTLVWAANKIGLDYYDRKATRQQVDDALDHLHDVAARAGLPDREIEATIRSGFDKGAAGKPNRTSVAR
jgi:hypothetical protein